MADTDLTGRSRLVKNVFASYLGHFVFIIFGFILPRAIDSSIGQFGLGIWDFCWSFVNYLTVSMIGIGSSVNRFVARYRAREDTEALNNVVSTVVAIQVGIGVTVFAIVCVLALWVPVAFAERLGEFAPSVKWVIFFLGASLAVQMAFDAWRGVLTGCHRWDYYNALNAIGYLVISLLMLLALWAGYGLAEISAIYFVITVLTELIRYKVARAVCSELQVSRQRINRVDASQIIRFGLKTVFIGMPVMITIQSVNILLVAALGPAALAILARPLALVRQVAALISKFANVLTPTAGSMQSQEKLDELRVFALKISRYGLLLAVPPLTFMFVLGDHLVGIWMGEDYAIWSVSAILAAGHLLPISQGALLSIFVGMDAHGRIALLSAVCTVTSLVAGILIVHLTSWSLPAAAMLVAAPITIGVGGSVLFYGFRFLEIGFMEYLAKVVRDGFVLLLVIGAVLTGVRLYSGLGSIGLVAVGMTLSCVLPLLLHFREVGQLYRKIRS